MILQRLLDLPNLLNKKSFSLFGPRATGKSFLIREQFPPTITVLNLLKGELYILLSERPYELEPIINAGERQDIVVIDEVQRVPMLLHEVHRLIEERGIRFLLTGSSARKLKQKNINLLAGRAWEAQIFPLTYHEIPNFNLGRYLRYGGLPPVYLSNEPDEELHAYVRTYLQEEIQMESLVRRIPAFSRFLTMSALSSGQIINFSSIANDTGIPVTTIREYYQILEDTFIGFMLPAWTKTLKRKAASTGKFYLFDLGVKNTLANIKTLEPQSNVYGQAFEHLIVLELRAYLSYRRLSATLSHWRSQYGDEVDFILDDEIAIEVKTTSKVNEKHLKSIKTLQEENICKKYFLVSHDPINRKYGQIEVIYWQDFLERLWQDKL